MHELQKYNNELKNAKSINFKSLCLHACFGGYEHVQKSFIN